MEDYSFILDNMTFSYSNLSCFCGCKHEWKLKYIDCEEQSENVYGQFGSFCHNILEMYENGELKKSELARYYEEYFDDNITEDIVFAAATAKDKLFDLGMAYFSNCDLPIKKYKVLGVEYECNFKIDNHDFIGYIDLLLQDEHGNIIILDHKSSEYPFNKTGKIKKSAAEKYQMYKRQLYLYSKAVYEEFGIYPQKLVWNYFKDRKWDIVDFSQQEYEETLKWAEDTINDMYAELSFEPRDEFFYCRNLCGFRYNCEFAGGRP